jgi:hypothetical protein
MENLHYTEFSFNWLRKWFTTRLQIMLNACDYRKRTNYGLTDMCNMIHIPHLPKTYICGWKGRTIFPLQLAELYNIPFNMDKLLTASGCCHNTSPGTNNIKAQNLSHLPSADKPFVLPMYSNIQWICNRKDTAYNEKMHQQVNFLMICTWKTLN